MGESAHGLRERAERSSRGVRPELPEPGGTQHHEARVQCQQLLRPQPPPLHDARTEVLNQDVAAHDQPAEDVLPGRSAEREGHRALVTTDDLPPETVPVLARAMRTRRVTARM